MTINDEEIKKAKIEWYSRKKCVENYYSDRFIESLGRIRDDVQKKIVLNNVHGKVLDAGCGPGRFTFLIAKKKGIDNVIGIDASTEMLTFATQKMESGNCLKVKFVKGDIQLLPFKENTFDSIVCVHVLFHLPQYSEILKEFVRVLKPGGWVIVQMNSSNHINFFAHNSILKMLIKLIGKEKLQSKNVHPSPNPENPLLDFYNYISLNECQDILKKAGAKKVKKYTCDFPNSIWLTNGLLGSGKWINKLLNIKLIFNLFSFFEVYIFRYLPTSLGPMYFIIAEKNSVKSSES